MCSSDLIQTCLSWRVIWEVGTRLIEPTLTTYFLAASLMCTVAWILLWFLGAASGPWTVLAGMTVGALKFLTAVW